MAITSEQVAHSELVGGSATTLHSHSGGSGVDYKAGTTTTNSSGIGSVTFTTAFADTNYAILMTSLTPSDVAVAMYYNKATTGFGVETREDKGGIIGDITVDWLAIGYSDP